MKKNILILFFFGCLSVYSQGKETALKTVSFPEIEELQKINPKPIIVFIYTDWCKICHGMKQQVFNDKKLIEVLNTNFYFVELNAEEKENIQFLGNKFVFKPSGRKTGVHELAEELATIKNSISYPTTTILNQKHEIDFQFNGYLNKEAFLKITTNYMQ